MRQMQAFAVALCSVVLATACTTAGGSGATPSPEPSPPAQTASVIAMRDSILAQSVADHEGPHASIRAEFVNLAGSRRVQGVFHLDDDAYVLIGHIDADGVLRVVFPLDPADDGFVKGGKTYRTQEFFAGFSAQFQARLTSGFIQPGTIPDSYDQGTGYLFLVASWRPMRFDQISAGEGWDSFEVADANYMRDPRPAIQELAAVLSADSREAYTVEYAHYYRSQTLYAGVGSGPSSFGFSASCSGLGFSLSPFGYDEPLFAPVFYAQSLWSRGTRYYYDASRGCYRPAPYSYYNPYGYPVGPRPTPLNPTSPLKVQPRDRQPKPRRPVPSVIAQVSNPTDSAPANTAAQATAPHLSPAYRSRGLLTVEDPSPSGNSTRNDRVTARSANDGGRRPPLSEMMQRRATSDANGSNNSANSRTTDRWSPPQRNARDANTNSGTGRNASPRNGAWARQDGSSSGASSSTNVQSRPEAPRSERPRVEAPQRQDPPQRQMQRPDAPQRQDPPQRHEAPHRVESPRAAPPAAAAPQPRSAPAAAPSSPPPARTEHTVPSKPTTPPL